MSEGKRVYNQIYTKLVENDTDFIGLLAYSIYKRHKLDFCAQFLKKNDRHPNDTELQVYYDAQNMPGQLELYRKDAEDRLSDMVTEIAASEIKIYQDQILNNYEKKIAEAVKSNTPTSINAFVYNVFASLVATIIAAILAYVGYIEFIKP